MGINRALHVASEIKKMRRTRNGNNEIEKNPDRPQQTATRFKDSIAYAETILAMTLSACHSRINAFKWHKQNEHIYYLHR